LRRLQQPGPARPERWLAAPGALRELAFALEPGLTINAAIAAPLQAAGIRGATVELSGGAFGPFTYVMPALSSDPRYAAFYSASHTPPGRTAFERGVATFGERDGAPFIHCHGIWQEEGGRRGGHVMPLDTIVAEPIRAHAYGTAGATFAVLPDSETNFSLFTPVAERQPGQGRRVLLLKVQPNEPLDGAILAACRAHGFGSARIHGIGSIIGARFADGRYAPSIATELFLNESGVGGDAVELDITLVDVDGAIHTGRLAPDNPVCITCELCLVETEHQD
jgi:predicted DNA-binding protein with PD1-like motif